jgi:hypothetical protein
MLQTGFQPYAQRGSPSHSIHPVAGLARGHVRLALLCWIVLRGRAYLSGPSLGPMVSVSAGGCACQRTGGLRRCREGALRSLEVSAADTSAAVR